MAEQTYREIQLTKKELVFLFMSAVVVLAVVFLLGISVGRSVGAPEGVMADAGPSMASDTLVTTQQPPTEAAPGELTYHDDLQGGATTTPGSSPAGDPPADPNPAAVTTDPLPTAPPPPDPDPVTPPTQPETRQATPPPPPPATPPPTTPPASQARSTGSGQGTEATGDWALQFGAFASRDNANRLTAELKQKGYAAYIANTADGLFAVRVGPFQTRAEADSMRQRLAAEPQGYKPLIISR
jgi:cell division septation protein DedD